MHFIAQCLPHAKLHSTQDYLFHQPWQSCGDTLVGNVNATSSFKRWKSLVSLIKRSHITSSKGLCRLHVCPTSSPMGLYQIPSGWGPNSNLLVDLWVKPPLKYLVKPFAFYIVGVRYKTSRLLNLGFVQMPFVISTPKCNKWHANLPNPLHVCTSCFKLIKCVILIIFQMF
jgi:hypothetical protein